jgi:hypothetical protein
MFMAWIKHALGLDVKSRVHELEDRMPKNKEAVKGAIEAFKQFARDADR